MCYQRPFLTVFGCNFQNLSLQDITFSCHKVVTLVFRNWASTPVLKDTFPLWKDLWTLLWWRAYRWPRVTQAVYFRLLLWLSQAAAPSQTLSQNVPELGGPTGILSPALSQRQCRVGGSGSCTQRKLQHGLHSPETAPVLCVCRERFPRQELLPVLLCHQWGDSQVLLKACT